MTRANESELEESFAAFVAAMKLPDPVREYRFAAEEVGEGPGVRGRLDDAGLKDWRFDFAWPCQMLAVEVEGGAWVQGRHTRGAGFSEDIAKYDAAMRLGWTVYKCDGALIKSGRAADTVALLLAIRGVTA